jgi:hypothetical protein
VENLPELLPGLIGHEISHVIASKGKVELTKEDLALITIDRLSYINAKEKSAEDVNNCFTKEIQSKIKEWDMCTKREETENSMTKCAQLVNQECFDKLVLEIDSKITSSLLNST